MNMIKKGASLFFKLRLVVIFISVTFLYSCKENPGEFTIGEKFIESQTDIHLIDTFSVKLSTVILDTVITSGTGSLLVGNFRDNIFGSITSHSYFQVGIPESFDVKNNDVYDSLNLVIRYNQYSFGDTTKNEKILVHQLIENIKSDDNGYINSRTSFSFNPDPIGSIIYTPEPSSSTDTLFIRLSDIIGLDLFSKLRDNSNILTDKETFINYFHGLVLKGDDNFEGAIVGFNAADAELILYTSRSSQTIEQINYEFRLEDSTKQFNNISHDFTSTQLSSLVEQRNEIPSTETGGMAFLQGGIGLVMRVDLPSLQDILLLGRGKITEAQLSISPLTNSYTEFDLPPQLIIYKSDKLNRINWFSNASSTLTTDEPYHENTSYSVDITNYIIYELSDFYIDPTDGILISLPSNNMSASFYRLITDAQNQKPKLKIYYLTY